MAQHRAVRTPAATMPFDARRAPDPTTPGRLPPPSLPSSPTRPDLPQLATAAPPPAPATSAAAIPPSPPGYGPPVPTGIRPPAYGPPSSDRPAVALRQLRRPGGRVAHRLGARQRRRFDRVAPAPRREARQFRRRERVVETPLQRHHHQSRRASLRPPRDHLHHRLHGVGREDRPSA